MDQTELNMIPGYAFVLMTIYFLQNLERKVLPCLQEVVLEGGSNSCLFDIENNLFDYDLFEKKVEEFVSLVFLFLFDSQ